MTAEELIERLSEAAPEARVRIATEGGLYDIEDVVTEG